MSILGNHVLKPALKTQTRHVIKLKFCESSSFIKIYCCTTDIAIVRIFKSLPLVDPEVLGEVGC